MASAPSRRTGEDHGVRTQAGRTAAANSGERSAGRLLRRFPAGSDRAGIRAPHDRRSDEHDGAPEPLAAGGGPGRGGAAVRRRDRPLLRGAPGQRVPDESLQHGAGGPARLSPGPRDPRPGDETGDRAGRRVLAEYRVYLSDERGAAAVTVRGFTACAAMFLEAIAAPGNRSARCWTACRPPTSPGS